MKHINLFENWRETKEENWLEDKTDDELQDMYNTLMYQLNDVPYGIRDYAMARSAIAKQIYPISVEIRKRKGTHSK